MKIDWVRNWGIKLLQGLGVKKLKIIFLRTRQSVKKSFSKPLQAKHDQSGRQGRNSSGGITAM